jgi:hypothetical protein
LALQIKNLRTEAKIAGWVERLARIQLFTQGGHHKCQSWPEIPMTSNLSSSKTNGFFVQLDSRILDERLSALAALRELELRGQLGRSVKIGPILPSYNHIHTTASYGFAAPGVFSVAHMVWAAHEAHAYSTIIIEHESVAHLEEAEIAVAIVNRGMTDPLRLILGVEFKAQIALNDPDSRLFSNNIANFWGQGEAAWIVGVGAKPCAELTRLVGRFQEAKRVRASQQLAKLNRHLVLIPPLDQRAVLTPDGNVTDRLLCLTVAKAKWPDADDATLARQAGEVRKLLNPGGAGYAPFPSNLPSYQELIHQLARLGMTPTFTAQLRGQALAQALPLLKSWGVEGLDVAGIEPDEPDAEQEIRQFIKLAKQHGLALFGGSDYRGVGTGWVKHSAWMDDLLIRATIAGFSNREAHSAIVNTGN